MGCFDDWGGEWSGVRRNMEHRSYFDDRTLSKLAEQACFQVILLEYRGFPLGLKQYKDFHAVKSYSLISKGIQPNIWIYNTWQKLKVKVKNPLHRHELLFVLQKV